jgi:hypothetical protein
MNVQLTLKRQPSAHGCTIGELFYNGKFFCYTLEDVVRPAGQHVAGETAIPAGTYPVTITPSPAFRILTPRLGGALAGRGVLIHAGNAAPDTRGCILVGLAKLPSNAKIYKSREAFELLMGKLLDARTITLTIE